MSFFQIHSKTHRVVRANRVFISADGWADGLRPKGGKSKKGPGMLGWCWMDLDWYLWISGNPATNTNEHVFFFKPPFFFQEVFFSKSGLELEMDLVVHFFDPKTPKRTTQTLQQAKGFHHCKSLLSEGLMPSYGIVFFTTFIGRTCFASCLEGKKLSDLRNLFWWMEGISEFVTS